MPFYPVLAAEMAKRGITKKQIANALGINYKTFYNKWNGLTPFTWPEVCKIKEAYFPEMTSDELFAIRQ